MLIVNLLLALLGNAEARAAAVKLYERVRGRWYRREAERVIGGARPRRWPP